MMINKDNCDKFLKGTAVQFARIKVGNDKLPEDDAAVTSIYTDLKDKVAKSSGPKLKTVVSTLATFFLPLKKASAFYIYWRTFAVYIY